LEKNTMTTMSNKLSRLIVRSLVCLPLLLFASHSGYAESSVQEDQQSGLSATPQEGYTPSGMAESAKAPKRKVAARRVAKGGDAGKKSLGSHYYEEFSDAFHAPRYPNELTPAQWATVMLHHRVHFMFTADEVKILQDYLQNQ
jgi:hypothetical protein